MEYMSKEGYDKIQAELQQLINIEYPKVKEALIEARDKGDLSENFEYHAAKRAQSRLIGRIRYLQKILRFTQVIETERLGSDTVGILNTVEMTNLDTDAIKTFTIVSPHEANIQENKISIKSPIAQALMGKKVGDIVEVRVPAGIQRYRINSIQL
ncbi:MAG: transcription elongation factor GreA [Bacteroidales bacterium]|nr:transcription elongation factor GreA [Bacteroidales bacterium]